MALNTHLNRRTILGGLAASTLMLSSSGAAFSTIKSGTIQIIEGLAFGSSWRLVLEESITESRIRNIVQNIIKEVDDSMSPYKKHSELSRFNRSRETDWQTMSEPFCYVASEALKISKLTDGAFDPTVGPAVSRYGFGPIRGEMDGVGSYRNVFSTPEAIKKSDAEITLDLCGIAKGYAVDQILTALKQLKVRNAFVEVGGEVRVLGAHPNGRHWRVGIESGSMTNHDFHQIVEPMGKSLATSGHSINGIKTRSELSHIINARQQKSAHQSVFSVSVLADTTIKADALATALCAMGAKRAISFADREEISALFIIDPLDKRQDVLTGEFPKHMLS